MIPRPTEAPEVRESAIETFKSTKPEEETLIEEVEEVQENGTDGLKNNIDIASIGI